MSDQDSNRDNHETPEPQDELPVEAEASEAEEVDVMPDDGAAETSEEVDETPEAEIERLTKLNEEYLDGWQRARADFVNYKKRIEREQREAYRRAAGDILTRYLGIVDDLERALKDRPTEGDPGNWADGVELIYRKLRSVLEAEGVEIIDALGQPFDPNLHEAISHEDSDEQPAGYVIDVVQQGYRMGDQVLRPALVRVAK
ncbi:MAG: nucleotide exchange factor GrpE [Anaerolineales bacterium]